MTFKWQEWTVVHVSMFVTFIISSLCFNAIHIIAFLTIKPINLQLYRKISNVIMWLIHSQVLMLGTHYSGSQLYIHADPEVIKEIGKHHGIFLLNHHYEVDWLFTWMVADAYGCLGNGKVIAKKMLKYVPTIGISWALNDMIFLDRNWEQDKTTLTESMNVLASYKQPFWLLLYPEGTRLSQTKLEQAQKFATSRNLPVLKHQLYPRTKGFARIIETLDTDKVKYVYDATLMINTTKGAAATLTNALMGRKIVADMYVKRHETKDIPKTVEDASKFLVDIAQDKDMLIQSYKESNMQGFTSCLTSDKKEAYPEYEPVLVEYKLGPMISTLLLNIVISVPIVNKLGTMALSGSIFQMFMATAIVAASFFVLKKFIGITQMDKVSRKKA